MRGKGVLVGRSFLGRKQVGSAGRKGAEGGTADGNL